MRCLPFSVGTRGAFGGAALRPFGSAETPFQAALAWSSYALVQQPPLLPPLACRRAALSFLLHRRVWKLCVSLPESACCCGKGGLAWVGGGGCPCGSPKDAMVFLTSHLGCVPLQLSGLTTRFSSHWVGVGVCLCLQREKQPGSQREAGQLGIWARQPALGSGAQRGPAGLRRGGGVELPLAAPGFSCHFINTLIESKAAAG